MKFKLFASLAAGVAMLFTSCENDFDPNLYGTLNPGEFPSNASEYTSYMMTCYLPFTTVWTYDMGSGGVMHGWFIPSGGVLRMFDAPSDICGIVRTHGGGWTYLTQADFNQCVYYWRGNVDDANSLNHFPKTAQITRMTEIIGVLENAPSNVLSDNERTSLIGEAKICRGLMMYYLLHNFGPVAVILDPTKVIDSDALAAVERPTLDQMTGYITEDFEYAAKYAPETAPDRGRFTRDFAKFCLMRHYLNEGEHMPGYYQKAVDVFGELNNGKYSLFKEGSNPYADLFKNAHKFNCEIIAAISCDETADGNPKHGNFNPVLMHSLPTDVAKIDPFPMGGGWIQLYSIDKAFYDTFEAGDLRRNTILTSYMDHNGNTVGRADIGVRWNGFILNKWPQETHTTFQGQDIPLARWADALLLYAEAETRLKGTVTTDALKAVNDVRARAGLGGLPANAIANKDAFLDAILLERAHETFFEGNRKIDLIRFNKYAQSVYKSKGVMPTHQYMPLPNYAVEQAAASGHVLEQTWHREGWDADVLAANPSQI